MNEIAKTLIVIGLFLTIAGVVVQLFGKFAWGRLPGDILIKKENLSFYIPITTSILISLLLSLILYILNRR